MAETVSLQVLCNGQVVASSDFTYYEDALSYSNSLFHVRPPSPPHPFTPSHPHTLTPSLQYLVQNLPEYFNPGDVGGGGGVGGGAVEDAGVAGGFAYTGNIPGPCYGLLLGACRWAGQVGVVLH